MEQHANYATDPKNTERMREKLGPKGATRQLTEALTQVLELHGSLPEVPAWMQAEYLVNCLGNLEIHHARLARLAANKHLAAADQRQAEAAARDAGV